MDEEEKKAEIADILQILRYGAGQTGQMSVEHLIENHMLRPEEEVRCCVEILDEDDYPVVYESRPDRIRLTDRKQAEEIIKDIRSDVYS